MKFKLNIEPPTVTAQEHKVKVVHGRPLFYDPPKVRHAKGVLSEALMVHAPLEPLTGPVELRAVWKFKRSRLHRHGEWRTTRPDTDNLQKLLKDIMTGLGFWNDDAQVVRESVEKMWSNDPGLEIEITELEAQSDNTTG